MGHVGAPGRLQKPEEAREDAPAGLRGTTALSGLDFRPLVPRTVRRCVSAAFCGVALATTAGAIFHRENRAEGRTRQCRQGSGQGGDPWLSSSRLSRRQAHPRPPATGATPALTLQCPTPFKPDVILSRYEYQVPRSGQPLL